MRILSLPFRAGIQQAALFSVIALLPLLPGCNRQTNITVTGMVLRNGQPLKLSPTGTLQLTLKPDVGESEQFTPKTTECDRATGKFEIHDVRPGKYKIGVQQLDPNPQVDKLNGGFLPDKSNIIRDLDGKTPLTIDLAKPE
ncbi:MAG TPA: hypothetical protein VGI40_15840 [Pirellulaceae bacterium]|jgi:hypothetical protein